MPDLTIKFSQEDWDAAERIAKKMFPYHPDAADTESVLRCAAFFGMGRLIEFWLRDESAPPQICVHDLELISMPGCTAPKLIYRCKKCGARP